MVNALFDIQYILKKIHKLRDFIQKKKFFIHQLILPVVYTTLTDCVCVHTTVFLNRKITFAIFRLRYIYI